MHLHIKMQVNLKMSKMSTDKHKPKDKSSKSPTNKKKDKGSNNAALSSGSQSILGMFRRQKDIQRRISELEDRDNQEKSTKGSRSKINKLALSGDGTGKAKKNSEPKYSWLKLKRKSGESSPDEDVAEYGEGSGHNECEIVDAKTSKVVLDKSLGGQNLKGSHPMKQTSDDVGVVTIDKSPSKLPKGQSILSLGKRKKSIPGGKDKDVIGNGNNCLPAGDSAVSSNTLSSELLLKSEKANRLTRKSVSMTTDDADQSPAPAKKRKRQESASKLSTLSTDNIDNRDCLSESVEDITDIKNEVTSSIDNTPLKTNTHAASDSKISKDSKSLGNTNEKLKKKKLRQEEDESQGGDSEEEADEDAEDAQEETELYRVPYYLENLQLILRTVLDDEYYSHLFNDEDRKTVQIFYDLSEPAQKLYARLFGRKFQWIRQDKIVYPKIAEDLTDILEELVKSGLIYDESSLTDLATILDTLPAPDLRNLAKTLRINTTNQLRVDLRESILRHSRQCNISTFFQTNQSGSGGMIINRAKSMLGKCFRLVDVCRAVFIRTIMLFALHQITGEEDEMGGGQLQLFQILMTNIGKIVYPTYTVQRETQVFPSRQALLRFEAAVQIESDIWGAMKVNDFETVMSIYETAKPVALKLWKDKAVLKHDKSLDDHLQIYTAGSVYARILSQGVEVLQKRRDYKAAVALLEELLKQKVYHSDYRGRWFDRLALNMDQHLKQPGKALDVVKEALKESDLRWGHRYALLQRAQRLCSSSGKKCQGLKARWKEFKDDPMAEVKEAPKVFIEGRQLPHAMPGFGVSGRVYISDDSAMGGDEVTVITRVEDVALQHYAANGYPQGIHGEGGTFHTLFTILFWDIIFMDGIADVFLNPFQSCPLDIGSNGFYPKRKKAIDDLLEKIKHSTSEELETMLEESWTAHEGVLGVNWEKFENVEQAKGLVSCMGGAVLSGIFERPVKHMSHPWGGMPDLVVWNMENKTFRLVEVKGPGDRLSTKQILWLDYFMSLGAPAEVCHVAAVAAKKLKKLVD